MYKETPEEIKLRSAAFNRIIDLIKYQNLLLKKESPRTKNQKKMREEILNKNKGILADIQRLNLNIKSRNLLLSNFRKRMEVEAMKKEKRSI